MDGEPKIDWRNWSLCIILSLAIAMVLLWHARPGGPVRDRILNPKSTLQIVIWNVMHPFPYQPPAPTSQPVHLVPRSQMRNR